MRAPILVILFTLVGSVWTVAASSDELVSESNSLLGSVGDFLRDQRTTGAVRFDYFHSSRTLDDETGFYGATAQIKALPSIADAIDGKLEARVTNPDVGGRGETDAALLEGYFTVHFQKSDLRVGKQIVAWGRADGINPTDNLTPHDFVVPLPFEEDQRFGTTALKLDIHLTEEMTFTTFTTPFFAPSKIPLPAGNSIEVRPAHTLSNSEVGLKLNKAGGDLDWSVSYFHGYSLLPDARVIATNAGGPIVELHYDRIDVMGADIARNFGRYGFRGEVAYFHTRDEKGTDPGVKNPYLFYVVGGDRTFLENLNVNLQFFGRWVRYFHDPEDVADPVERGVAVSNAIIDSQQDRVSYGWSSRISQKWLNDTLEAELLVIANATRHDTFIRPLLSYAFSDHFKGTLGGEVYRGADDTTFGRLKRNRGAFAELRYSF